MGYYMYTAIARGRYLCGYCAEVTQPGDEPGKEGDQ